MNEAMINRFIAARRQYIASQFQQLNKMQKEGLVGSKYNFAESVELANYAAAAAVRKVGTFAIKLVQLKEIIDVAYNNANQARAK